MTTSYPFTEESATLTHKIKARATHSDRVALFSIVPLQHPASLRCRCRRSPRPGPWRWARTTPKRAEGPRAPARAGRHQGPPWGHRDPAGGRRAAPLSRSIRGPPRARGSIPPGSSQRAAVLLICSMAELTTSIPDGEQHGEQVPKETYSKKVPKVLTFSGR